jgi:S-sulfosulfanyl-L-cysteine sulfohydrolase
VLEDVADNLFHPDPYYQQGGDMVRSGGLQYSIAPLASVGSRISDLSLNREPIEAHKIYKVAGWASIQKTQGEAIWDVVSRWLRREGQIGALTPDVPAVMGLTDNLGHD